MSELIYLATPYNHTEREVVTTRYLMVNKVAAKLMSEGKYIFSPISHNHSIIRESNNLPRGWEYWQGYDKCMLSMCNKIIVLKLPGWQESSGVSAEIKIAKEFEIPIEYLDYDVEAYKKLLNQMYSCYTQ